MKSIKLLFVFAIIGIIAVSCKETKKEEVVDDTDSVEIVDEVTETTEESASSAVEKSDEADSKTKEESVEGATNSVEKLEVDDNVMVEASADTPVIYPGCKGTNEEIRGCSKEKFIKFLKDNFDSDLASESFISTGKHLIRSLVKIDKEGRVSVIEIEADKDVLKKEMIRVIDKLPQLVPATKNGAPISVRFVIPLEFDVVD